MLKDIVSFFKGHWPHIIIAIPAAIAFTAVHELAHCAAVWVQGGSVTKFVWLPSGTHWGYMRYSFPPGVSHNATTVSLSPYALWVSSCLFAGLLSLRRCKWPFWFASTVFVWLFIAPLTDIANTAVPYLLLNADNDFRDAFGPTRPFFMVVAGIGGFAAAAYGHLLCKRLYRERAIGLPAYSALGGIALIAVVALTTMRLI